jgi:prophage DNA circulation protein
MGRHAVRYQITGYVIQRWGSQPIGNMPVDYDIARDQLVAALESIGPGTLVDPYNNRIGPMVYQCERYSMTETRERGGYAQFEMAFIEAGAAAFSSVGADPATAVQSTASSSIQAVASVLNTQLNALNHPGAAVPLLTPR